MKATAPRDHVLLPGEAGTVFGVVTFLFASSGILGVVGALLVLSGKALDWEMTRGADPWRLVLAVNSAIAVGFLVTAWLLRSRRRLGGALGLGFIALSLLLPVLQGPFSTFSVVLDLILLVALALAWSHLSSDARRAI